MNKLLLFAMLSCAALFGQDTRASAIDAARARKEQNLEPPEEPGLEAVIVRAEGNLIYRLLTSTEGLGIGMGQMVPGAGFSIGPRYQHTLLNDHLHFGATA